MMFLCHKSGNSSSIIMASVLLLSVTKTMTLLSCFTFNSVQSFSLTNQHGVVSLKTIATTQYLSKQQQQHFNNNNDRKRSLAVLTLSANNDDDNSSSSSSSSSKLKTTKTKEDLSSTGLPQNISQYKARLVKYSKEMYKDPPVLPPPSMSIDTKNYGLPQRNSKTGELEFQGGDCEKLKEFCPNRTPEEVLRAGSFGGTYFRAINSAVTNICYIPSEVLKETVKPEWIEGLNLKTQLTSQVYKKDINKYGVKCGGSLGMWESSGCISDADPYGWFQWYCRFYNGRRCEDDSRQVSRWLKSAGAKGRFRSQLCNKILAANTHVDDTSISPVIRQTLLHWGLEITDHVLQKHRERIGK